jgi:hypothetical protein
VTLAVAVPRYVFPSPGVNAPKLAGVPSVSASCAGTVADGVVVWSLP